MDGSTKVPIGYMQLSTLYARNKRATINDTTTFYITDQSAFGRFTSAMITSQNFTWQLENYDLSVQAEKFPTAHGISFNKPVTINGKWHSWFSRCVSHHIPFRAQQLFWKCPAAGLTVT